MRSSTDKSKERSLTVRDLKIVLKLSLLIFFFPIAIIVLILLRILGKKASTEWFFKEISEDFSELKITWSFVILLVSLYFLELLLILMGNPSNIAERFLFSSDKNIIPHLLNAFYLFHSNIIHLLSNVITILMFGRPLEFKTRKKFLYFLILCCILNNVADFMISRFKGSYVACGASGIAIAIMVAASIVYPTYIPLLPFILPIIIAIFIGTITITANVAFVPILTFYQYYIDVSGLTSKETIVYHEIHIAGYFMGLLLTPILFRDCLKSKLSKIFYIVYLLFGIGFAVYYIPSIRNAFIEHFLKLFRVMMWTHSEE